MLKIERIISVSSEHPAWPAENLLKDEGKSKWKCKSVGERTATLVLQLDKACKIKSIDVGNENSAFIEILVGKSSLPDNDYKVLLVASSLMSLKEAKDLSNANAVRFFKEKEFCKPEAYEKWDRIKIVCSQPYNKHVQFGLSFVKFHGEGGGTPSEVVSTSSEDKTSPLGRFVFKKEEEDDIAVGSIFARRKELQNNENTSAFAIRTATSQLLPKDNELRKKPVQKRPFNNEVSPARVTIVTPTPRAGTPNFRNIDKIKVQNDFSNKPDIKEAKKVWSASNNGAGPSAGNIVQVINKKTPVLSSTPTKRKTYKPFCEFMRDVIFAISGFQNPLRGNIRSKALEMGAKYKQDWDDTCTHLICAFINTPKFNQVKGHGKIVKKEWIEESYSKRVRLPWRRYALDPSDSKNVESEEEIFEGDASQNGLASTSNDVIPAATQHQPGPSLFGDVLMLNAKKRKNNTEKQDSSPKKKTPKKSPAQSPVSKKRRELTPEIIQNTGPSSSLDISNESSQDSVSNVTIFLNLDLEEVEESIQGLGDTESEQECTDGNENNTAETPVTNELSPPLPYLPEQFNDLSFYVAGDFLTSVASNIKRYIVAHSGSVQDDCNQDTEYVIAHESTTVDQLKEQFPQIIGVKAEWIWRCHDENRLLPTSSFEL